MAGAAAREKWNERHARATADTADDPPAEWVVAQRDLLAGLGRGRALDVAAGRGRHAWFLAGLGFEVDALDVSDVAVDVLRAGAAERALPVRALRADLPSDRLGEPPYQVVVVVNFLERSLFAQLEAALAPGGLLVYETFTRRQAGMNPTYALASGELLRAFPALDVLRHREAGPRAGLVARRP